VVRGRVAEGKISHSDPLQHTELDLWRKETSLQFLRESQPFSAEHVCLPASQKYIWRGEA
jgi:hypothetical protein